MDRAVIERTPTIAKPPVPASQGAPAAPPAPSGPTQMAMVAGPSVAPDALGGMLARAVRERASSAVLMRAGDPMGMMREHPVRSPPSEPQSWTYHHIIPENIIEDFWEAAVSFGIAPLDASLSTMVTRGYQQLEESAIYSMKAFLSRAMFDFDLSDATFEKLARDAVLSIVRTTGDSLPLYEAAVAKIMRDSNAKVHLDNNEQSISGMTADVLKSLKKTVGAIEHEAAVTNEATVLANMADPRARGITEQMIRWMPGNIHQGPSSSDRRSPGKPGFDAERDDGGETFEIAARHLIPREQYATLRELHDAMLAFTRSPSESGLEAVGPPLRRLSKYSVTQWESVKHLWWSEQVGQKTWWRIRPRNRIASEKTARKILDGVHAVFTKLRAKEAASVSDVFVDHPTWSVTTTRDRHVAIAGRGEARSVSEGAIRMADVNAVLDEVYATVPEYEER